MGGEMGSRAYGLVFIHLLPLDDTTLVGWSNRSPPGRHGEAAPQF